MNPFLYFAMFSALYFAQGLPSGLIAHALPVVLRELGVALSVIGLLKLLALPWLLKFIWAPFVDRTRGNPLQARGRWITVTQLSVASCLAVLGWTLSTGQSVDLLWLVLVVLLINVCAATQDIATDSLAVLLTPRDKLGSINSIQVSAYKVGMIAGGSGCLLLLGYFQWGVILLLLAGVSVVLLLPLLCFLRATIPSGSLAGIKPLDGARVSAAAPPNGTSALKFIIDTYRRFFRQKDVQRWLVVLVSYKISDSMGSVMLKPMLLDQSWAVSQLGELTLYSSLVGLVGALAGGYLYKRVGRLGALVGFGALQSVSVSAFYFISLGEMSAFWVTALVFFEQFSDGLSTVALFACMMHHCRQGSEGADYTVQASIQIVLAGLFGAASGFIAEYFGYDGLYLTCGMVALVAMGLVVRYAHMCRFNESISGS